MRALVYDAFATPPELRTVPDPAPEPHGVVLAVKATGLCRSDWHGWAGHDPDITLPHVPGHEVAGVVQAVGREVMRWAVGDRVTVPFVGGCGTCPPCLSGQQQVCDDQFQPGFTHWGTLAEYVSIHRADLNLVRLPPAMDYAAAASLGCRFITAFRALVDQGRVAAGQWVAVHGCGGVGLSAVMIAQAMGAHVIGVDITEEALARARALGAVATVNATQVPDVVEAVVALTQGGAHVSLDALGHPTTCVNSILSLRKQGKHVQVGLLLAEHRTPALPMDRVIAYELEILGSHGMQAHRYGPMLAMIESGRLNPAALLGRTIGLEAASEALMQMDQHTTAGVTVVTPGG
ncbi:MAG: zinc-dependent alcohol dehydrogenase family protein [Bacteroidota bacterium]